MDKKVIQILILFLSYHHVDNARILGSAMVPSHSHHQVFRTIWKELARRGHELVVLTPAPMNDPTLKNLKEIDLSFTKHIWNETLNFTNAAPVTDTYTKAGNILNEIAQAQLSHPEVQALIKNPNEHFDLFIVQWLWPTMYALQARFECPMVGISSVAAIITGYHAIGNPNHPVLNPDYMLPFWDNMNFAERIYSCLFYVFTLYRHHFSFIPQINADIRKYIGEDLPSIDIIQSNVSMVFLNKNPITSTPLPNVPALMEFSGLSITKKKEKCSQDIQTFLDNATEGVVYFSLGSNVKSTMLSSKLKQDIIQSMSELPYKFLWKYEDETLAHRPDNVKISKWLPQQAVLDHRNTKLFITQGGVQSLDEAIYYKVPLVGIPFFADQPRNVKKLVQLKLGIGLDARKITKKIFKEAIIEVMENVKYRQNMEKYSKIVRDQPMEPLDKIMWWIEYVMRHNGAKHLRSPYADISWAKYLLLDVISFFVFLFIALFYFVRWIFFKKTKMNKLKKN